jgi:hypothetical protein
MVKEAAGICKDEESDGIVIWPPDGNTHDCEQVVRGSDHDISPVWLIRKKNLGNKVVSLQQAW